MPRFTNYRNPHPGLAGQRLQHLLVRGVHFLGFEGAAGGAVLEAVGEGLAVGGEFLAGGVVEDVEALEGDEQGLGENLTRGGRINSEVIQEAVAAGR